MNKAKERQVQKIAEDKALEYYTALPIDPVYIAKQSGIAIHPFPDGQEGVSGMLCKSKGNFGILYSTNNKTNGFQRFSIAHELGHYFIPGHAEKLLKGDINESFHQSIAGKNSSKDEYEKEADSFAAAMLMPSPLFDNAMNQLDVSLNSIKYLSELCQTSVKATAIRYVGKCWNAIAVVVSNTENKIRYSFQSDEFQEFLSDGYSRHREHLPQSSREVTKSGFSNIEINEESTLLDWFEFDNYHKDVEVREEKITLGQYGNLSLLILRDLTQG
ncbi:TPA: ImmA/IrrE family metallo-endopeptidase [Vibrio parahaemolyticus]|nr:ImmA/IrrE family metallo-endopeptidase [Vibrio parahaemolyticus]